MALEIIGAGFGRTGTLSMKKALEILGFGPCHHMLEVISNDQQREIWRRIAAGETPDWGAAFDGYRAMVDWPGAHYWRELSEVFPQAKILLTVRSPKSWYKSAMNTIFASISKHDDPDSVGVKLIREKIFDNRFDDEARAIAIYQKNIEDVTDAFGDDRLLVYHLGDGWQPLCEFLDRDVPSIDYPSSNSTKDFQARAASSDSKTS